MLDVVEMLTGHDPMGRTILGVVVGCLLVGTILYGLLLGPRKAIATAAADEHGRFFLRFAPQAGRRTALWLRFRREGTNRQIRRGREAPPLSLTLDVRALEPGATVSRVVFDKTLKTPQRRMRFHGRNKTGPEGALVEGTQLLMRLAKQPSGCILECRGQFELGEHYTSLELLAAPSF